MYKSKIRISPSNPSIAINGCLIKNAVMFKNKMAKYSIDESKQILSYLLSQIRQAPFLITWLKDFDNEKEAKITIRILGGSNISINENVFNCKDSLERYLESLPENYRTKVENAIVGKFCQMNKVNND